MTIAASDLRFYKPERLTDEDDGGGQMTATEIVWGVKNSIFDDITDVDGAGGDVSIRQPFCANTSAGTEKLLDAGVIVFEAPADPDISVLMCSLGDHYAERAAIAARIEQSVTRAGRYNGYLYGMHVIGQRSLILWQRPEVPPWGATPWWENRATWRVTCNMCSSPASPPRPARSTRPMAGKRLPTKSWR